MSELHLFKTKRVFTLQVINIKNFLIRGSTKSYNSIISQVIVSLSVIRSRVIKCKTFVAKDNTFVKNLFTKLKKNIYTLIARDKLPVHTTRELHAQGFEEDPLEYSYLDDLKDLGNIE